MDNEKALPQPLSGEEVRTALLAKIDESFARSCHLKFDNAYTEIEAKIRIEITAYDYGREVKDNHIIESKVTSGLTPQTEPQQVTTEFVLEKKPPNVLRVETGQDVPIAVTDGKKTTVKRMRYTPRKEKA